MLGFALMMSGCARPRLAQTVPAHAPDSIASVLWNSLTAPANIMTDPPGMRGRWARNLMFITFRRAATQAERQAVIDRIHGEGVGGNPPFGHGRSRRADAHVAHRILPPRGLVLGAQAVGFTTRWKELRSHD